VYPICQITSWADRVIIDVGGGRVDGGRGLGLLLSPLHGSLARADSARGHGAVLGGRPNEIGGRRSARGGGGGGVGGEVADAVHMHVHPRPQRPAVDGGRRRVSRLQLAAPVAGRRLPRWRYICVSFGTAARKHTKHTYDMIGHAKKLNTHIYKKKCSRQRRHSRNQFQLLALTQTHREFLNSKINELVRDKESGFHYLDAKHVTAVHTQFISCLVYLLGLHSPDERA